MPSDKNERVTVEVQRAISYGGVYHAPKDKEPKPRVQMTRGEAEAYGPQYVKILGEAAPAPTPTKTLDGPPADKQVRDANKK